MSNSVNPVVKFNGQMKDFMKYLINICPDKKIRNELSSSRTLMNTALRLNSSTGIQKYILHILEYEEYINARDDNFFMSKDFSEQRINEYKLKDKDILETLKIKKIWTQITEECKEKIFDYMIILTYWARKYFNEKYSN